MPRPPQAIGTYGTIGTKQLKSKAVDGKDYWRAWATYRDTDGKSRPVNGYGPTEDKAKRDLRQKLAKRGERRQVTKGARLTADSKFSVAIDMYLEELEADETMARQTIDGYRRQIERSDDKRADPDAIKIRPSLGEYRCRELDTTVFDEYLREITAKGQKRKARWQKTILSEICEVCIRHRAMPGPNPIDNVGKRSMRSKRKKPQAAAWETLNELREQVEAWARGEEIPGTPAYTHGPRRDVGVLDVMDMAAATGARPHEVLAFRWEDVSGLVDEGGNPLVRLVVCGTVVQLKGEGAVRQEWTKTHNGYRSVVLPWWAVMVLRRRWEDAGRPSEGLIFPSRNGTVRSPNNFNRTWRAARGEKFAWITLRTYRKTLATALHDARGIGAAGEQLGHAVGSKVTQVYIERATQVSDNRDVLEAYRPRSLAAGGGDGSP
ncbi:site-specific integrase [Nocardia wallacei]|uniref:site-specific integrase n=1 Tax=Nocardia wallacei TaxID=480035 RepID=UPI002455D492|nr:site-specific integrase [Nocardia wallacei]